MRLLTALLFVSAMSAEQAQWQNVRVLSLSDKEYRDHLLEYNQVAKKVGNPVVVTDTHMRLSKGKDPLGYKTFSLGLKKEIEQWLRTAPTFQEKKIEVVLEPYGTEPGDGDVQVSVVWYRGPGILPLVCPGSLMISDGIVSAAQRVKTVILRLEDSVSSPQSHR